jgi:hypothetical protein
MINISLKYIVDVFYILKQNLSTSQVNESRP